ncbi:hypothetical protein [Acidimangrovimonas pyrenivorans]|uniref:Uncharacterized protein n=1 Tax=Acidimangrovimonas pyrenivorans TaxID=2030798 RepID=A0ABV7ALP4_9RHOB
MSGLQALGISGAVLVPVIVLVLLAVATPRLLARVVGRGARAAAVNLTLSALLLTVVSGGYFAVDYLLRDPRVLGALGARPVSALAHFGWLGLMAGLVWGPVMLLSLTALPQQGGR